MKEKIRCFYLTPTDIQSLSLRRYKSSNEKCSVHSYHNALVRIQDAPVVFSRPDDDGHRSTEAVSIEEFEYDHRWPTKCDCGYVFKDDDHKQIFTEQYYKSEDGKVYTLKEAPIGAMWNAWWMPRAGADGLSLMVRTPGGDWFIDSRASNCTLPDDDDHRCWVRHGEPPCITVGKDGNTCGAGAGSIAQKNYHGFLQNGFLERC